MQSECGGTSRLISRWPLLFPHKFTLPRFSVQREDFPTGGRDAELLLRRGRRRRLLQTDAVGGEWKARHGKCCVPAS